MGLICRRAACIISLQGVSSNGKLNLESLSLKDLVALEAKIKVAIDEARARNRAEVKAAMADLAEQHGFSVNDLFGTGRGRQRAGSAVPKYANPENKSDTWSGRGRRPRWVVAQLKKGRKLEDFAI